MSLLSKLADRMILCPSTDPIDPNDNRREVLHCENGIEIEAYVSTWGDFDSSSLRDTEKLLVLKIPGTGGRAERSTVHPCELIVGDGDKSPFKAAQVWTLNHRGYGQSSGPASLQHFVSTIEKFWTFMGQRFPNEKKLVAGNSLGCISALYLARHKNVDSILIRNPPPLARLIADRPRYNAWNFGMAKFIANQVPSELDSLVNASGADCPALLVTSEKDRVVPFKYQQEILDVYRGPIKQFVIQGAGHADRIPPHQESEYLAAIDWLGRTLTG
jgi:pimeloyl-ACP methyl ester carboxylesterase